MIDILIKERDFPLKLEGLAAAQSRLLAGHPALPVLSAKHSSMEAGIGGEDRVAEIFKKSIFPFDIHIYHDLSLSTDVQIDIFGLTPWYGIVLEVKNISGILEFKENPPQLVSTKEDGHKYGYENPAAQLQRNCEYVTEWLWGRNIQLPIYRAVILAYPKQIVTTAPTHTKLLFPNLVPSYIKSIPQQGEKLDPDTFQRLSHEIVSSHQPFIPAPISESYKIPFEDFQPGTRCYMCGRLGMVKHPRTWLCPTCKDVDHLAHQRNLLEWFLIHKRTITNRECRDFLHVDIHTANRILKSMNFPSKGTYRDRVYIMDFSMESLMAILKDKSHKNSFHN
ncbi:NERD domain-containing protein [Neobacillus mesonae]|nr:NERD domain-containing protein [Neobacillus mesonae]